MSGTARAVAPALLITLAASCVGHARGLTTAELARGMPAVFLLLSAYFGLAVPEIVSALVRWCSRSSLAAALAAQFLLLPYLLYAASLGCFSLGGFLRLLLYVNLPLLTLLPHRTDPGSGWRDAIAVLVIWLPLDFRLLGPLWPWPPGQSGYFLFGILGVSLAVFLFVVLRGMSEVGYTFTFRRRDWILSAAGFLLFAPLGIAFGLLTGFLRPPHTLPSLLPSAARALGIFLVTGIPEELLFRGLVQNLIQRWTSRPILSVALAAVIFGLAHLNNGPRADPRLFLLATLAGAVYGLVYRFGGTLVAPALTHTLVDTTWSLFFRG